MKKKILIEHNNISTTMLMKILSQKKKRTISNIVLKINIHPAKHVLRKIFIQHNMISYYLEDNVDPGQPDHQCHVDKNVDPANIISPHFQFEENNNLPSYESKDQDTNTSKLKLYKINTFLLNIIGNV